MANPGDRVAALPDPIEAIVLDFDGVFTDNTVYVFEDGREAVRCHRGDGWGFERLRASAVPVLVLSTERNPVVRVRCDKLGLECLHGIDDKVETLDRWLSERGLTWPGTVYVGNDLNDMGCFERAGCPVAPSDAVEQIRAAARIVLDRRGGEGAVRELIELILSRGVTS